MSGPRVVAIGGGHGTAVTLRAAATYASSVCGVVSVADDGGSSGRLSELLDVVALGDLRRCLVALAEPDSPLAAAFEHRFRSGELDGHPLGNLVLAALVATEGDVLAAIDEAGRLLGARGRLLPATTSRVALRATGAAGEVTGQVRVGAAGRLERVALVGDDTSAPAEALAELASADQVVIGPGSLYTSVLAAAVAGGLTGAMAASPAQCVYVCNLREQTPETDGYRVSDHVAALVRHGVPVDVVVVDDASSMALGELDVEVVCAPVSGANRLVHDPLRLAAALVEALARSQAVTREAG